MNLSFTNEAGIVRGASLTDGVVSALERAIAEAAYEPGARLPTEAKLAEQFGVSRAVIREAISRLKADGYIVTRQGAGAFVAAQPGLATFRLPGWPSLTDSDLRQIFELRAAIESAAAALAATRRSAQQLQAMRDAMARMDTAIAAGSSESDEVVADGARADDDFHRAVADATGNPHMARFIAFLSHQFSTTRRLGWQMQVGDQVMASSRAAQQEHQRLLAAIEAGDEAAARAAADDHLARSLERLLAARKQTRPQRRQQGE